MYESRFALVEDYLDHLDPMMAEIRDAFIQSRYLGFIATSAVTAYELAIKDIFYNFADRKHLLLGSFARAKFDQMNGRIKIESLKREHVNMFGTKYVAKFEKELEKREKRSLRDRAGSVKASYGNIIAWRHSFVHQGLLPSTTTYAELKKSYHSGKEVIHSLSFAMTR